MFHFSNVAQRQSRGVRLALAPLHPAPFFTSVPTRPQWEVNTSAQCVICKAEAPTHEFNIFYSFWFLIFHAALSPPASLCLLLSHCLPLFWPFQNLNEIKWSLICMHLQNIACAVFAIKGMGKGPPPLVVVVVGVYVLPHWHQTVLWYGNGRAKEEWLLAKALFGYRPRSIPPSLQPSLPIPPTAHRRCHHFSYFLALPPLHLLRLSVSSLFVYSTFTPSLVFLLSLPPSSFPPSSVTLLTLFLNNGVVSLPWPLPHRQVTLFVQRKALWMDSHWRQW